MRPYVSVVMSVHNGEEFLEEAMESILNQTYRDFEFIILDDDSTDRSPEIIKTFAEQDKRIRVVTNEANLGLTKALNKGISLASGKYLARMDADDISYPQRLAKQVQFLEKYPEIGLLGSAVQVVHGDGVFGPIITNPETHNLIKWALCYYCPLVHPSAMVRYELFSTESYLEDRKYSQDYDLWTRLIWHTKAANLQDVLLQLRKHRKSISITHIKEQEYVASDIQREMINRVLKGNVSIDIIEIIRQDGRSRLSKFLKAQSLIVRLYREFLRDEVLSKEELNKIKTDSIRRLLNLSRARFPRFDTLFVLIYLVRIDALLSMSILFQRLKRRLNRR